MRRVLTALGGLMLAQGALADMPPGDPEAGRKIVGMCRTCHGLDGIALIPIAPHIGGEPESYLTRQLAAFRDGSRQHEMMSVVAQSLTDKAIADLAAWYASHTATGSLPANADTENAPEACIGCHGLDGIAVVEDAPHLAGENVIYIETQLKAFRFDKRTHDVMSPIAKELPESDLRAVAQWFADIALEISDPG